MHRKAGIIGILLISLTLTVSAAEFQTNTENLDNYKELANSNSDALPDFVKDLIGDQDINIYLDANESESYNLSLQMNGTRVDVIDNSSLDKPDIEVWTSTDIVENITESDQPVDSIRTAIEENEIEYQSNDTWTQIKIFFAEAFMSLF